MNLWDARKMDTAIYSLDGAHTGEVTNVNWSCFHEHVLASSGVDRRVVVWDLSRIGDELTSEEAADGPPSSSLFTQAIQAELMILHGTAMKNG